MNIRSEFNKLARVRVDIPSSLDSIWMLDVKKSSAKIPDKIKDSLQVSIKDSIVRSKREIKYPVKKEASNNSPLWRRVDLRGGNIRYEINRNDNPLYLQLLNILDKEQIQVVNAYLDKIEEFLPKGQIVSDNADSLHILNSSEMLEEEKMIDEIVLLASMSTEDINYFIDLLLSGEPYLVIKHRKKDILERVKNGK